MIRFLAIANFRSLHNVILPLGQLNVVIGSNGTGKSSLYRSLRLLAQSAQGNVVGALAHEGGLPSALWAGPQEVSVRMLKGEVPVEGLGKRRPTRLQLGFMTDELGYTIAFGYPSKTLGLSSVFDLDPEIKAEYIWAGGLYRAATTLMQRNNGTILLKERKDSILISSHVPTYESLFHHVGNNALCPEVHQMRNLISNWRFYDYFRTDYDAPVRKPQLGTRTPVLHHDGHDLAAALQTIIELGDAELLAETIADAFPDSQLQIDINDGYFSVGLRQKGMLRQLNAKELSDGTLRFLLLAAALLTPRPPTLMVLNEPENSLHSDLIPALARLIVKASKNSQLWIISHSLELVKWLVQEESCNIIELKKMLGQTYIKEQGDLAKAFRPNVPPWNWPPSK